MALVCRNVRLIPTTRNILQNVVSSDFYTVVLAAFYLACLAESFRVGLPSLSHDVSAENEPHHVIYTLVIDWQDLRVIGDVVDGVDVHKSF